MGQGRAECYTSVTRDGAGEGVAVPSGVTEHRAVLTIPGHKGQALDANVPQQNMHRGSIHQWRGSIHQRR
eukprot:975332-Prorocentrum_minimum.AAC.1